MDLKTLVLVILMAVSVNADCSSGVNNCLKVYLKDLLEHENEKDLCNDIKVYIKCVFRQGCYIDSATKQKMIDSTRSSMAQLDCPFTMASLINEASSVDLFTSTPVVMTTREKVYFEDPAQYRKDYGNSAALLSPISTTLIMMMSFTLLIMKSVF